MLRCLDAFDVTEHVSVIKEVSEYAQQHGIELNDSLRFWAMSYQPEFRNLPMWLCAPNKNRDLGPSAVQFLHANNEGIAWNIDFANDNFDETGNDGYPIFSGPSFVLVIRS